MSDHIVRFFVEGRVQRVGYRVFVARDAGRLHLDGWVRNRRDGSVETLVACEASVVEEFLRLAQKGPATARIDAFRLEEADDAGLREGGGGHGFVAAPDV